MSQKTSNRPAGLTPLLYQRWSPRAFDSRLIAPDAITRMLAAAQWAMSCFNAQPWRIVYATKDNAEAYERLLATLMPANQTWAVSAPLIGIAVARAHFEHNGQPNGLAAYDTGAAMALFSVQAEAEGLKVHQMGGFDAAKAKESLGIPEGYTPLVAFVAGYVGDAGTLSEPLRGRELEPGSRKSLAEVAFEGRWPATS
jgi:nitroreductase